MQEKGLAVTPSYSSEILGNSTYTCIVYEHNFVTFGHFETTCLFYFLFEHERSTSSRYFHLQLRSVLLVTVVRLFCPECRFLKKVTAVHFPC